MTDDAIDWSTYSDVLDNRQFNVEDRANALAHGAKTVRIAVGYFYLGGFDLLKENLQDATQIHLLIGTTTNQQTIEELQRGFEDNLNEFDKNEAKAGIKRLYELIQEDRVDVRVYDNVRFHPKLYLFTYDPSEPQITDLGRAIIGSSNLSPSGLRHNIELNVEKKDNATIRYLTNWFEELWEEASEFDTELMSEDIRSSQFGDIVTTPAERVEGPSVEDVDTISPYEATKRFIVEQFEGEVEEGTLLQEIRGEYEEQLTAFQQDAVRAARRPLEKYNGVILADSVGLGKSYIGAPLVQEYTTSLDEVLVIAPNRLKSMWMDELLDDQSGEFPTNADTTFLSFAALSRLSETKIQRLRGVDLVLIDEAHNLRNTGTQRYSKLQSIGRKGKKFVLLTATPIHNSVRDVDNVIKVFADNADFDIELRDLTPSEIFREYDNLASEEDLSATKQSTLSTLEELIESIMREVIISRDRRYILDNYDDITIDGEPITVPDRVPRLITPDDPRLDELYSDIVETVIGPEDVESGGGLNIPYVSADRYDADGDDEEELILEYQNASILMLITLLKRLESSLAAFEESIDRLIQRERITRSIATGNLRDAQSREAAVDQIRDTFRDDFAKDINFTELAEAIDRISQDQRDEIVADIEDDLKELHQLRNRARDVLQAQTGTGIRDAKVERLETLLTRELDDEKILVFSQYIPTVRHIFNQVTDENPDTTQIAAVDTPSGERTIAYIHGSGGFGDRLVERFAPRAQNADVSADEEVDVLITTDVLGAGQNLQDARTLVNYDLHWNPMKMEQRIGRIDRITTRHDELLIYNFAPTGDLRRQLGLMERIQDKIQDIAKTFGHSAPILDSAEEQVHKTIITYERLDRNGAEFGDERLEGIGSKYDDLRNSVKTFCEDHTIAIEELQDTLSAVQNRSDPQFFVLPTGDDGLVTLVHLSYSSGRDEWRATVFDEGQLQYQTIGGQSVFSQFPRRTTDEVRIFNTIASPDPTRYELSDEVNDTVESLATELQNESTWENSILSRDTADSSVLTDIKQLCNAIIDDSEAEVHQEAQEILSLLAGHEMSDWAESQLRTIHRRRRRYGTAGTINRLHRALTTEIELVEPEHVTEADVALAGKLGE